ncbi:MAG: tRNA 4-thiouridine(8) synthase ThiI [Kiritimatiellae bacterium]|nr:tRNA 4-thiouridine(8) synthase ThiI [Kiritimatiellia bacterium]
MNDNDESAAAAAAPAGPARKGRALCLCSGGLDSMLAMCVLREQGVRAEAVTFTSPFYANPAGAKKSLDALGFPMHEIDFTPDILALLENPPSGFGSCLNPCIDCHARMIARAWEYAQANGFDFVATGEVLGQRPMSQQRPGLNRVRKLCGAGDFLVRPLCAKLLDETEPERRGLVDREKLLALNGRNRKPQMEMARKFGIREYPTPAGGCKLTEPSYCRRLKDVMAHEGLGDARLLRLLDHGRLFRLPGGTLAILGRNRADNEALRTGMRGGDVQLRSVNVPGPTALAVRPAAADEAALRRLVAAYSDHKGVDTVVVRELHAAAKPVEIPVPVCGREEFQGRLL